MAFRILTDKEIDRLNAADKAAYEAELAEYQKRAAFVERLEKQAQMKMPEVHPSRIRIRKFRNADVKSFNINKAPAVSAPATDGLRRSLNAFRMLKNDFTPSPVSMSALPTVSVPSPSDSIRSFKSFSVKPAGKVPLPAMDSISFKPAEVNVAIAGNFPQIAAPDVNVNMTEQHKISSMPSVCLPSAVSVSVSIPPAELNSMPEITVAAPDTVVADIPAFKLSKTADVRSVAAPDVTFAPPAAPDAAVPAVNVCAPAPADISVPDVTVSELPHVVADAPVICVSMPAVGDVSVCAKTVSAPVVNPIGLSGLHQISEVHGVVAKCPDVGSFKLNVNNSAQLSGVCVAVPDNVVFTPPEPVTVHQSGAVCASAPVIDKDALLSRFSNLSGGINEK